MSFVTHGVLLLKNIKKRLISLNKIVQHLFDAMFSENPVKGYEKFEDYRKNKGKKSEH